MSVCKAIYYQPDLWSREGKWPQDHGFNVLADDPLTAETLFCEPGRGDSPTQDFEVTSCVDVRETYDDELEVTTQFLEVKKTGF